MADPLSFLSSKEFLTGLLTGGGLAALWKWVAGWNLINLSLALENRRTSVAGTSEQELVSLLKLKQGDRATLSVESIHFLVTSDGKEISSGTVQETALPEVARSLRITPGEETHFAFHCRVPANAVCKIVATVTGRSLRAKRTPLAVWKASEVSVPRPPERDGAAKP